MQLMLYAYLKIELENKDFKIEFISKRNTTQGTQPEHVRTARKCCCLKTINRVSKRRHFLIALYNLRQSNNAFMLRSLTISATFLLASTLYSQDTFSIVAVDTVTGEVGSAGAPCVDLFQTSLNTDDFLGVLFPEKAQSILKPVMCRPIKTTPRIE